MKKFILISLLAGITLLIHSPLASAVSIDLVPVGTDVNIVASDLGGQIVSAYDMDVSYNPLAVTATGVSFSNALGDPLLIDPITLFPTEAIAGAILSSGLVDFFELSLLSDPDLQTLQTPLLPSFTLATLHFTINDPLATPGYAFIWDPPFNDVKGFEGELIYPNNAVPEPSTMLLIGSGLLGIMGFGRKFKK
jgi:hypothetical protein